MPSKMKQPPSRTRTPVSLTCDRNFDDLAHRFSHNVYGSDKGELRLAVIQRDFQQHLGLELSRESKQDKPKPPRPLRVLDAGGGQGQIGLRLANQGHFVTVCDISSQMLDFARQSAEGEGLREVDFVHDSIQNIAGEVSEGKRESFDLVICHAVLEWVVEQEKLIHDLSLLLSVGGHLSLTFYNSHGLVMKNLLRGHRPAFLAGQYKPNAGSLTPTRPLDPQHVLAWLEQGPWQLLCHSGIRVFYDYLLTEQGRAMLKEDVLELELLLSLREPYRSLGRYQHLLLRRFCSPA